MRKRRRWRRRFLLLVVIAFAVAWMVRAVVRGPSVPEGSYVQLDLTGSYPERPPDGMLERFVGRPTASFLQLIQLIRDAAEDGRIAGMVVRVRPLSMGWARAQDVREALRRFHEAGKPLYAYVEGEFAGSTMEYYVASVADKVYLPRAGSAPLSGLMAQYVFLGGLWEKLDIDMQVEKIREYKTAGDMLARKGMSRYHREMANSLLDSLFGQVVSEVARRRGMDERAVRSLIDKAPTTAEEFVQAGLADGVMSLSDLRRELLDSGEEFLSAAKYREAGRPPPAAVSKKKIALVYGVGTITTGESASGFAQDDTMGADTMAEAFRKASEDDNVAAIVFRVDSPGGSALASDLIWQSVRQARARKPVIASLSDVAASGGYYASAAATRVIGRRGTLTGSIGVVMAKPNVSGFLAKLGVNTESVARGERAQLLSLTNSLTPAERIRVRAILENVYRLFVARVAEGRKLSKNVVDNAGKGRVWTGEQAAARGLVDELGGFIDAIDAAKAAAGIPSLQRVTLVFYPERKALAERLLDFIASRAALSAPRWWSRARDATIALRFRPGSALTLMPQRIEIR